MVIENKMLRIGVQAVLRQDRKTPAADVVRLSKIRDKRRAVAAPLAAPQPETPTFNALGLVMATIETPKDAIAKTDDAVKARAAARQVSRPDRACCSGVAT